MWRLIELDREPERNPYRNMLKEQNEKHKYWFLKRNARILKQLIEDIEQTRIIEGGTISLVFTERPIWVMDLLGEWTDKTSYRAQTFWKTPDLYENKRDWLGQTLLYGNRVEGEIKNFMWKERQTEGEKEFTGRIFINSGSYDIRRIMSYQTLVKRVVL